MEMAHRRPTPETCFPASAQGAGTGSRSSGGGVRGRPAVDQRGLQSSRRVNQPPRGSCQPSYRTTPSQQNVFVPVRAANQRSRRPPESPIRASMTPRQSRGSPSAAVPGRLAARQGVRRPQQGSQRRLRPLSRPAGVFGVPVPSAHPRSRGGVVRRGAADVVPVSNQKRVRSGSRREPASRCRPRVEIHTAPVVACKGGWPAIRNPAPVIRRRERRWGVSRSILSALGVPS